MLCTRPKEQLAVVGTMLGSGSPCLCGVEPPEVDLSVCWMLMEILEVEEPGQRVSVRSGLKTAIEQRLSLEM